MLTPQQVFLYDTPRCTGACSQAVYQKVYKTAAGNAIVAMMGTVPGYFFTVGFVDILGRIPIQFGGELAVLRAPLPSVRRPCCACCVLADTSAAWLDCIVPAAGIWRLTVFDGRPGG